MTPLGALIEEVVAMFRDAHRIELTYGDISRRSGRLSRQRVQQLAKGELKEMPSPENIRALAVGLGVPESVVLERALESVGYPIPRTWRRDGEISAAPMSAAGQKVHDELQAEVESLPGPATGSSPRGTSSSRGVRTGRK